MLSETSTSNANPISDATYQSSDVKHLLDKETTYTPHTKTTKNIVVKQRSSQNSVCEGLQELTKK